MGLKMENVRMADFDTPMSAKPLAEIDGVEAELSRFEYRDLPPQMVKELAEAFRFFDLNGDGKISKEELGTVVRSLGEKISDANLEKLVNDVDVDGDGYINLQEFIELNTRAMNESTVAMWTENRGIYGIDGAHSALVSAFNVFDVNKDGFISAEELHRVLVGFGDEKISVAECRSMIDCVDEDGDQMVDFREFQSLMSGARLDVY